MSQHVFELNQSVNNREVSFKVGKSIIEYLTNFSDGYPMFTITIDNEPGYLIREATSTKLDNCFGPITESYGTDRYVEIFMDNNTGNCTIKGYGDHTIELVGLSTATALHAPTNIVPEKTVVFEW